MHGEATDKVWGRCPCRSRGKAWEQKLKLFLLFAIWQYEVQKSAMAKAISDHSSSKSAMAIAVVAIPMVAPVILITNFTNVTLG